MADAQIAFEPFLDDQTRRFIVDGVDMYNVAATSMPDYAPVNFVLRGERGDVLGGLLGQLWGAWLHVGYLWVSGTERGKGYGARLLSAAEDYARTKGAVGATLETYSFQARPFYERQGYELCGTLDGYPPGHAKFFLRKPLAHPFIRFRKATEADADLLTELEQSGGLAFRADPELAWLADGDNIPPERYREIIGAGWSWVAEDAHSHPLAFLAATREGKELHIWEFNVRIEYQHRGIGRRLLQRFITEVAEGGLSAITLTTFRDVPWNAPFYTSMGFEVLSAERLDRRLAGLLDDEARKGLPAARRCAMRRQILVPPI
jgi:GNAT superfamily N-acetyltransferase